MWTTKDNVTSALYNLQWIRKYIQRAVVEKSYCLSNLYPLCCTKHVNPRWCRAFHSWLCSVTMLRIGMCLFPQKNCPWVYLSYFWWTCSIYSRAVCQSLAVWIGAAAEHQDALGGGRLWRGGGSALCWSWGWSPWSLWCSEPALLVACVNRSLRLSLLHSEDRQIIKNHFHTCGTVLAHSAKKTLFPFFNTCWGTWRAVTVDGKLLDAFQLKSYTAKLMLKVRRLPFEGGGQTRGTPDWRGVFLCASLPHGAQR